MYGYIKVYCYRIFKNHPDVD